MVMLSPQRQTEASLDVVRAMLASVPFFEGVRLEDIGIERLGGALTNTSYKVTGEAGAYVLRIAGEGTSSYVDRSAEEHNARVAAAVGVNAEVIHFDVGDGTMLTRFIDGTTMDGESFGLESGAPVRAALALRRVHGMGRAFSTRFDVFSAAQGYLDLLDELGTPLLEDYRAAAREVEVVRRALESSPAPLVPCHNDPWPGNFLEADGRIHLIDWEYSGMNDPMWDLGDLSVEAGLGPAQDRMMMEAYHGGAAPPALYSRLELYKVMSDLHWSLWGLVQHAHGNPAEDFQTYALGRLASCTARLGSAGFGRHLGVVGAGYLARAPKRAYRVQLRAESPEPRDTGGRVASRAS